MSMRASGACELRKKKSHFHTLNLLFLSIFCWYFRYFVGTNDMLVGLHVPTNFRMYRQKSEKALWEGAPAPTPCYASEGYALLQFVTCQAGGWGKRKEASTSANLSHP